jgi:hypothetical protein
MTSTVGVPHLTASKVLFPQGYATATLAQALDTSGAVTEVFNVLMPLSGAARHEVRRQVAELIMGALDLDLVDLVMRSVRTIDALIAAGRRTAAAPASAEFVQLPAARVPWSTDARMQLLMDGVPRLQVHFELQVELQVELAAVVKRGNLTGVQSGQCTIEIALTVKGNMLATSSATVALAALLPLGYGIPLAI